MKRREFLACAAGLVGCGARHQLNVYNWSSYIAPETIPAFEKDYGVRVRYGVYESNEEMLAKVMAGNSGWDVVFPTNSRIEPMVQNRLPLRIDHKRLTNLKNLSKEFQAPPWDPGLQWSVPYMWNGTGIVYRKELNLTKWSDLWSDKLKGRLTLLDDPEDVIGACLLKLGMPFNSTNPRQLQAAKREALSLKKMVRAYINAEVKDQLVAGDVVAAQLWSTTASQAMRANAELTFSYPAEGFPLYADNAVILGHSDLAHEFINYLLRPEVAAANAAEEETASCNAAVKGSEVLYPPPEIMARGTWAVALPKEAQRLRDRIWTEIKAG